MLFAWRLLRAFEQHELTKIFYKIIGKSSTLTLASSLALKHSHCFSFAFLWIKLEGIRGTTFSELWHLLPKTETSMTCCY